MKIKHSDSILKHLSGRYGDTVFYAYRGLECARSIPAKVKPPSSPGQVAQQERMAAIAIFYQALKEVGIYDYWNKAAEGLVMNGYNLLVKLNLPAFCGEGTICDFAKLCPVTGMLGLPDELTLTPETDEAWELTWRNTPFQTNAAPDDRLLLLVMKDCETFDIVPLETGDACRRDEKTIFRIPANLKMFSHLYVVFCSRANGVCSESRYFKLTLNFYKHGQI